MNIELNKTPHDLPMYIYDGDRRAFLTLSADVYGGWSAGYHVWFFEEEGVPSYAVVGPYVNGGKTIDDAFRMLKEAMDA